MLLAGCHTIPDEGPSTSAVADGGKATPDRANLPYVVIDLDADVARRVAGMAQSPAGVAAVLPPGRSIGVIGVGDVLHITLWQADATGTTLLDHAAVELSVRVDGDGTISVPYAGRVRVAGSRPAAVERSLVAQLGAQTVAPQASVLVADDATNSVVISGEVARPGRVPLTEAARRLSDVIALAGGPRGQDFATSVTVQRGDAVAHIMLSQLGGEASGDIALSPGDRVLLSPVERHFFAFGAVNRPGDQPYTAPTMTLVDALGRIAGLQDGRANPAGLFVFRRQPAELTRRLMTQDAGPGADLSQVVYRVNLRDPAAFFVMSGFDIAPRDIVYVSNAPLAELGKFASILAGVNSIASTPRNFGAY